MVFGSLTEFLMCFAIYTRGLFENVGVGFVLLIGQYTCKFHLGIKIAGCEELKMAKHHGSLARAGKVKSQTPKVDKQEKKKALTGRAKKRMLYNRRYVNPTLVNGKFKCNPAPVVAI